MKATAENSLEPSISRRSFLKASAAAAATLTATVPSVFSSVDDTIKIALIGCGGRGTGAANQALSTAGPVKLVAMADVFKDRLDGSYNELIKQNSANVTVPEDSKFIGFDAYKKAIALADVAILTTPPGFRPIHFEEAVRQGKHAFMEKPVAVDAPGVRKVLAAAETAKKANLKVAVGLQRRHQTPYLETIQRLHDGAIGEIAAMRVYWNGDGVWVHPRPELESQAGRRLTEMEFQLRNWYYFVWLSGDHILEQHVHNLDVANWIKNAQPIRAWGMGGRQVCTGPEYGEIFDHLSVEYEYPDGCRLSSQCRQIPGCWPLIGEFAQGTNGKCDVSGFNIRGPHHWHFGGPGMRDPYQQEHDDFFAAIRNNSPYNEAEYGALSTMTAVMGRMANYSGKQIEWDDAFNSKIDTMPNVTGWDSSPLVVPDKAGFYPVPIPGSTVVI